MAELVVRTRSRSSLRQVAEGALDVTFPVWGVMSPAATLGLIVTAVGYYQSSNGAKAMEFLACAVLALACSLICLFAKRALSTDMLCVDGRGINLPRMLGTSIRFQRYIPWQNIGSIKADVNSSDPGRYRITIFRKKGAPVKLTESSVDAGFVEQLVLAVRMWCPTLDNESLNELQEAARIGARDTAVVSQTDLWEEELSRRFCPTAYIALEPGKVLRNSSLKVISHLASGGLSALYLCQLDDKKLVVLKEAVIPADSAEGVKEKARELFEREAQLLMKLDHPGIVRVLDCFSEAGRNYLLLEYVAGTDLRQLVKQNGAQSEADVLSWAIQVANVLKYLHEREQPIIHRDLTPDNIVLRNDGQIVIVDFGAANEFIGTATGTFVGKHSFIAPEQFRGKASLHSDIYAFGCTVYFLLTGTEPEALSCSNPKEVMPQISDDVAELVQSCTQMEARDRYQSVAQLLPVLRRLAAQSIVL